MCISGTEPSSVIHNQTQISLQILKVFIFLDTAYRVIYWAPKQFSCELP